jgi:hypothetical protein
MDGAAELRLMTKELTACSLYLSSCGDFRGFVWGLWELGGRALIHPFA